MSNKITSASISSVETSLLLDEITPGYLKASRSGPSHRADAFWGSLTRAFPECVSLELSDLIPFV